jgi:hypothetical protein
MGLVGPALALATIAALDLILLIGAGTDPPRPAWFGALTAATDLCLVASSALLGAALLRRRRRLLGSMFLANPALMLCALVLRLAGAEFGRALLFGAAVYWLNLYLVGLCVGWREIRGGAHDRPGSPPDGPRV